MPETDTDKQKFPPLTLGRSLWAIRPDVLPRLIEAHRTENGLDRFAHTLRAAAAEPQVARRGGGNSRSGSSVAVIPLTGIITPRGSFLSMLFGGGFGGLIGFREEFREALNDPDVGAIVLDVDSPGGLYDLVPETAAEVFAARGEKPIVAVANTMAASAAYFIASQADEVVVTPSGDVGSIGTYMVHEDWSGANEKFGVDVTYIFSSDSPYKVEGNFDEPLDEEATAAWQQEVDDINTVFVEAVAQARGVTGKTVREDYGRGRTLLADRALAAGMVDRVATLEAVIGDLLSGGSSGGRSRAQKLAAGETVDGATLTDVQAARELLGLPALDRDALVRLATAQELGQPSDGDGDGDTEDGDDPPVDPPVSDPPEDVPVEPEAEPAPEPDEVQDDLDHAAERAELDLEFAT